MSWGRTVSLGDKTPRWHIWEPLLPPSVLDGFLISQLLLTLVIPTACTWNSTESYPEETGSCTDFEGKRRKIKMINVGRKMKQNSEILWRSFSLKFEQVHLKSNSMPFWDCWHDCSEVAFWRHNLFFRKELIQKTWNLSSCAVRVREATCGGRSVPRLGVEPLWLLSSTQIHNLQHIRWTVNKGEKNTLENRVNPFNE